MAYVEKQLLINIYTPTEDFITTWTKADFGGFTKELNAGPSECILTLDRVFDYSGPDLLLGNQVELRVADRDTVLNPSDTSSRVIYRGYISLIERQLEGSRERVSVHVLGYYTLLALDILKNGSQTTLYSEGSDGLTVTSGDQEPADVGLMARAILDRYRAENSGTSINYDADDIPDTGTTATYSFQQKTYREALDALRDIAPPGTFYYIDEVGKVQFKTKPTTPTHNFIFGRHFNSVRVEHSAEKVRNAVLVWNGQSAAGQVYKAYEDTVSIGAYGRRAVAIKDFGVNDEDAADLLGSRALADNAVPDLTIKCTIIDNNGDPGKGYDIESVQPGHTCSFFGFAPGFDDIFRENMLITNVRYSLESIELQVELMKTGIVDVQRLQGRQINDIASGGLGVPTTYS
jgi:hypothetical protein